MTGFSALPLAEEQHNGHQQSFKGVSKISGPQWLHLPTLTIGLLAVQIFWSVEMSYASPYLLSLGLTKSKMAIVFIAGPLSGLIMQPLIGVLADSSTSRFGRRRPYMLLGSLICMFAMLLMGFTRQVASIFTGSDNHSNDVLTIWLAVISIYLIDFSINAVQAVDRALLVDTLPPSSQPQGNAWAARMLGLGSVVGFFVGNVDLPKYLPFLGKTQLQVISVVVSLLLLGLHAAMALLVKERILLAASIDGRLRQKPSFSREIKDIWLNMLTLPRIIRQICIIQFFAWLAWFPTLFYTTIYVGDLHKRVSPMPTSDEGQAALDEEATRLGSRALLYSSILSLVANVVLPAFVSEAAQKYSSDEQTWWERIFGVPRAFQVHLASLWAVSHLIFACCMLATFFTSSVFGATILITITGFSWAITQWAPFSLLAEAILTEPTPASLDDAGSIHLADTRTYSRSSQDSERERFLVVGEPDSGGEDDDIIEGRNPVLTNSSAQLSRIDLSGHGAVMGDENFGSAREVSRNGTGTLSAKAGIILGIQNVFIVIPQFLITALSAVVFAIFDPEKSSLPAHHGSAPAPGTVANNTTLSVTVANGTVARDVIFEWMDVLIRDADPAVDEREGQSNSVVYIFRFGGIASTIAFILCWRLARELRHR